MGGRLGFIEPMMPTLVDTPPRDGDWSTEVKFDGWRVQIILEQGGARVFTRRGHDWTDRLKIVAGAAAQELKLKSAIIDGELVYPHEPAAPTSTPFRRWSGRSPTGWCSWRST